MSQNVVLVIEDEELILENVLEILRMNGYEPHGAENGLEGVDAARALLPDLILCDINMPEMDGYNVLMELRSDSQTSHIPLVFLTAFVDREFQRRGMRLGAADYLTKPFTPKEVIEVVQTQIDRASEHRAELTDLRKNLLHALPHELRTPLAGILTCADLLLMDIEEDVFDMQRAEQTLRIVQRSGWRLQRLIENQLMYSQLEIQGREREQRAKLRMGEGIYSPEEDIKIVANRVLEDANRTDDLQLDTQQTEARVGVSRGNLEKMVTELVLNACGFSEAGQAISVECWTEAGNFYFAVQDGGRGMRPQDIPRIGAFMQFERDYYEQQGLGLGLAIVFGLAELHDGEATVESEKDAGTRVTVRLPLAPVE